MALPKTLEGCRELILELGRVITDYEKCVYESATREKLLVELRASRERVIAHMEQMKVPQVGTLVNLPP